MRPEPTRHLRYLLNLARREAARRGALETTAQDLLVAMETSDEPGIGATALHNMGLNPRDILERLGVPERDDEDRDDAPHGVRRGKEVAEVLRRAGERARAMGCRFVGSEHLLLAMAEMPQTTAGAFLRAEEVSGASLLDEIGRLLNRRFAETSGTAEPPPPTPERPPVRTPDAAHDTFQGSLCRQVESLLSQRSLWSKNPEILKVFGRLRELLSQATETAMDELGALDLPDELLRPAFTLFRLHQDEAECVARAEYTAAAAIHAKIEALLAEQAAMPPEHARLAGELIECEREKRKAVREERYEHAARCRDRSRILRRRWARVVARKPAPRRRTGPLERGEQRPHSP